jgi:trehalose-phosphatase
MSMFLPKTLLRQKQLDYSGKRVVSLPRPWRDWSSDGWWSTLAVAPRSVLLLDYDGTLAPFKTHRMEAAPYLGVLRRLTQLLERPKVRLILLSGRPAGELARLLPGLQVEVWGSNGRERLFPDGSYEIVPLSLYQSGALAWLESALKENGFSTVIETKPGGLALHTREREPQLERQLIELFPALFRQLSERWGCPLG